MNDDFSGPPGMDNFDGIKIEQPQAGPKGERHGCLKSPRRADSDRDVARARDQ